MIVIQGQLPKRFILACSGGVDSMGVLDFVRRKHGVVVVHVNHKTSHSDSAQNLVCKFCDKHGIPMFSEDISPLKPSQKSQEEHWRDQRYQIIDKFSEQLNLPAVTGHHLDDCVETWIWSSLHGEGKVIPYNRKSVFRPFRLNRKTVFEDWAKRHQVPWIEDTSNSDTSYIRNYIRHEVMPHALRVNAGIHKVIKKKVRNDDYKTLPNKQC